jgi:putative membrane protein
MRTLVLCVDRDDDFGAKTGLNSPFIGREENLAAAMSLGVKDPEDSDTNTVLAAISLYDEMLKQGMDVCIATICGDVRVGYQSDLALSTQLEMVLKEVKPDRAVLVSDGAEDEFIYPVISSRVKVDSVRKVYIKQAPTVESTYYVLIKMLNDDKIRKRILVPIGLALLVFGIFALLDPFMNLLNGDAEVSFTNMGLAMIWAVVGLYLLFFAYKVGDRVRVWWVNARRAIRSGSTLMPFIVLALLLVLLGIMYGVDAAMVDPDDDPLLKVLLFLNGMMWMLVFAYFVYQFGLFISNYLNKGTFAYPCIIASVTVFALGFIVQGTLDATQVFFGYSDLDQSIIILEMVVGFLLAGFGGLLNTSLRGLNSPKMEEGKAVEAVDSTK